MPVPNSENKKQYTADGIQITFPFPYKFFENTDLEVYSGATLQTLTTHYSVAGIGSSFENGGNVVFVTAPSSGTMITIVRVIDIDQASDYEDYTDFPAEQFNDDLDRRTMVEQQLQEQISRQLVAPVTDPEDLDMDLPVLADRAGHFLAFDAEGEPIAGDTFGAVPVSAFMETVLDDVSAEAAQTTLGILTKRTYATSQTPPALTGNEYWTITATGATAQDFSAGAVTAGTVLIVLNTGTGSCTVTLAAGVTTLVLGQNQCIEVMWDGTSWHKIGGSKFRTLLTSGTAATWAAPYTGEIKVLAIGGGGGGGGAKSTSASYCAVAGGGGPAATGFKLWHLVAGDLLTYSIGAYGGGGITTPTDGGDGGDTTVENDGNTLIAQGGGGGEYASATASHAYPHNNTFAHMQEDTLGYFDSDFVGSRGSAPQILTSGIINGSGGSSAFFPVRNALTFTASGNAPGAPAGSTAYGSGGFGGATAYAITAVNGGHGAAGVVILEF